MSLLAITPSGTIIVQLHEEEDVMDLLRKIGPVQVRRASHIEFDNDAQAWFIDMVEDSKLNIHPFRAGPFAHRRDALRWESVYLNARLEGRPDQEACVLAGKEEGS